MAKRYLSILISALLFTAFFPNSALSQEQTITVGSFNLEWLGHSFKSRDQKDLSILARYIRSLEVDVLCLQEVSPTGDVTGNGQADWQELLALLNTPDDLFEAKVGTKGGSQKLAFLWRKDRVELTDFGELKGVTRESVSGTSKKTFPRIPFTAFVKAKNGGVDFRLITVHLYFSVNKVRYAEAEKLKDWLVAYLATTADKDVLIIGDFNTKSLDGEDFDPADSETVTNLESLSGFQSISKGHIEYTTPLSKERYDHAFLSKDLREEELIAGSWNVRREVCETFPFRYLEHISNHCPVSLELSVTDNDPEPQGDWGIEN